MNSVLPKSIVLFKFIVSLKVPVILNSPNSEQVVPLINFGTNKGGTLFSFFEKSFKFPFLIASAVLTGFIKVSSFGIPTSSSELFKRKVTYCLSNPSILQLKSA